MISTADFRIIKRFGVGKKCAGVLRVPRPMHEKRDSKKAETFKNEFFKTLSELPIRNQKPVKVWVADESRYGLRSNLRGV